MRALAEDLLINVTEFFRDSPVFDAVQEKVFPAIIRDRERGEAIRVWVPGCSSGEEVYSIAICLAEYMLNNGVSVPMHIFGTDISERSIEKARAGIFGASSLSMLPPARLKRYFVEVDAGFQIARPVRDRCVFAVQNLAADPPSPAWT